jgi:hypothetical protein
VKELILTCSLGYNSHTIHGAIMPKISAPRGPVNTHTNRKLNNEHPAVVAYINSGIEKQKLVVDVHMRALSNESEGIKGYASAGTRADSALNIPCLCRIER